MPLRVSPARRRGLYCPLQAHPAPTAILLGENPSSLAVVVVFWYYSVLRFVPVTSAKWCFNFWSLQYSVSSLIFPSFCLLMLSAPVAAALHCPVHPEHKWIWAESLTPGVSESLYLSSTISTGPNPLILPGCWISIATGLAWEKSSALSPFTFCWLCLHCACLHSWGRRAVPGFVPERVQGLYLIPCRQRVNSLSNSPARGGFRRDCSIIP